MKTVKTTNQVLVGAVNEVHAILHQQQEKGAENSPKHIKLNFFLMDAELVLTPFSKKLEIPRKEHGQLSQKLNRIAKKAETVAGDALDEIYAEADTIQSKLQNLEKVVDELNQEEVAAPVFPITQAEFESLKPTGVYTNVLKLIRAEKKS